MIKQFLQQLVVLQALISFTLFTPMAQAKASSPFTQQWVNEFNYSWTPESSFANAKSLFSTDQDHKDIDEDYNKFKEKPFNWNFQMDENGVALWQDGQKQFVFNDYNKESVTINGKVVSFKKGTSYKKFQSDFAKAVKSKSFSFNHLFIDEAHAILPFLLAGAVILGVAGVAAANETPTRKCLYSGTVPANDFASNVASSKFKGRRICSDMPRNYQKRLRLVARNFNDNMKFNERTNTRYQYRETCINQYAAAGRPRAVQICKCIYRKQLSCNAGGWNMLPQMAVQTCQTAYTFWTGCQNPTTPVVDTPTPTACNGKNGQNTCSPQVDPPVVDTPTPDQPHRPKTNQ
mgnify:CR=1 FL=1